MGVAQCLHCILKRHHGLALVFYLYLAERIFCLANAYSESIEATVPYGVDNNSGGAYFYIYGCDVALFSCLFTTPFLLKGYWVVLPLCITRSICQNLDSSSRMNTRRMEYRTALTVAKGVHGWR